MSSEAERITMDGQDANPDQSEIVHVTDRGGNSIKFHIFEGKYYPQFFKLSDLQAIRAFDLFTDDIYLCAFPRTGMHWTFEMISMLVNGKAETIRKSKSRHHLELVSQSDYRALPRPRLLNTHMRLTDGPEQLEKKSCKVIYSLRDPKDVAVSLYQIYKDFPSVFGYYGEFKDFLYLFLDGKVDCNGIFGHFRDAERFFKDHPNIPVHLQVYEETSKCGDYFGSGSKRLGNGNLFLAYDGYSWKITFETGKDGQASCYDLHKSVIGNDQTARV